MTGGPRYAARSRARARRGGRARRRRLDRRRCRWRWGRLLVHRDLTVARGQPKLGLWGTNIRSCHTASALGRGHTTLLADRVFFGPTDRSPPDPGQDVRGGQDDGLPGLEIMTDGLKVRCSDPVCVSAQQHGLHGPGDRRTASQQVPQTLERSGRRGGSLAHQFAGPELPLLREQPVRGRHQLDQRACRKLTCPPALYHVSS